MLQISLMEHDDFPDLTPPDPKPAAAPDAETRPVPLLATCHSTSDCGWSSRTLSLNYTIDQLCCDSCGDACSGMRAGRLQSNQRRRRPGRGRGRGRGPAAAALRSGNRQHRCASSCSNPHQATCGIRTSVGKLKTRFTTAFLICKLRLNGSDPATDASHLAYLQTTGSSPSPARCRRTSRSSRSATTR